MGKGKSQVTEDLGGSLIGDGKTDPQMGFATCGKKGSGKRESTKLPAKTSIKTSPMSRGPTQTPERNRAGKRLPKDREAANNTPTEEGSRGAPCRPKGRKDKKTRLKAGEVKEKSTCIQGESTMRGKSTTARNGDETQGRSSSSTVRGKLNLEGCQRRLTVCHKGSPSKGRTERHLTVKTPLP